MQKNNHIIDNTGLRNLVTKICRDIGSSNWKPDYIVGLTRGGLIPAVMISHYFNVPCEALKVSFRDNDNATESNLWMSEDAFNNKKILIVDDINDTGATLNWIINDWSNRCHPSDNHWNFIWNNTVRFAVIVDNLSSACNVKMDYSGIEVNKAENDVWVDFPWEDWWTK